MSVYVCLCVRVCLFLLGVLCFVLCVPLFVWNAYAFISLRGVVYLMCLLCVPVCDLGSRVCDQRQVGTQFPANLQCVVQGDRLTVHATDLKLAPGATEGSFRC